MKQPEKLTYYDFIDTITVPYGYHKKDIPDLTRDNFQKLIDEHNNLVDVINLLLCNANIVIDD